MGVCKHLAIGKEKKEHQKLVYFLPLNNSHNLNPSLTSSWTPLKTEFTSSYFFVFSYYNGVAKYGL